MPRPFPLLSWQVLVLDAIVAALEGRYIPGLVAAAAPVLDWQAEVQAAVTIVGTDPNLVASDSDAVNALLEYCKSKSVMLER